MASEPVEWESETRRTTKSPRGHQVNFVMFNGPVFKKCQEFLRHGASRRGPLERTLAAPAPVDLEPPDIPAVYEGPAPAGSITPIPPTDVLPVLDPFAVYAQGEELLAVQLAALTPAELRTIIVHYRLAESAEYDFDAMTAPELAGWIVGAVRARLGI